LTRKGSHQNIAADSQNNIMDTSLFIAGGNPLEFVTSGPTKLTLPTTGTILSSTPTPTSITAATATLTVEDSGRMFFLNRAAGITVTLPAVASSAGVFYEFIVGTAPTTSYVISGGGTTVVGVVVTSAIAIADSEASGAASVTFVASVSTRGDRISLRCDGTRWYAYAECAVATAVVIP
jgi:hypothetical protein